MRPLFTTLGAVLSFGIAACEDPPKRTNPSARASDAPKPTPAVSARPLPTGPPDMVVNLDEAKIGFTTIALEQSDARSKVTDEITTSKEYVDGKEPTLRVDRKSKMPHVLMLVDALADAGATKILIKTETRKEYSNEIVFTPLARVSNPPDCSVAAIITEDRGTSVWKLSGGMASKRAKGFAGPDLSMTAETLERRGAACKESSTIFLSAAQGIEWGLAYDLAASTAILDAKKVSFTTRVLLHRPPIAGRKVDLGTD